jgi:ankyrin repeat protein
VSSAIRSGQRYIAVAKLLLDNGFDIEETILPGGGTALTLAAWWGHEHIVRLLLDAGADTEVKHSGMTPLDYAVKYKRQGVVKLLVEAGKAKKIESAA